MADSSPFMTLLLLRRISWCLKQLIKAFSERVCA
jgi:hypothetical protein